MKKTNAGFTLVEVVLAVSIAILVSVAAASVIVATQSSSRKAAEQNNAVAQAGAILECFKASKNIAEFEKSLEFAYGMDEDEFSPDTDDCDTINGVTLYLFFNSDNSVVYKTTGSTKTAVSEWDGETGGQCSYFAAFNISNCRNNGSFKSDTALYVAMYNSMSDAPAVSSASAAGEPIYSFSSTYTKGA